MCLRIQSGSDEIGKTLKKIVTTILAVGILVGTFGGVGLALAAGLPGFAATIGALQILAVGTLISNFAPEVGGASSRQLAENLSVFSSPTAVRSIALGRLGIAGQVLFRENVKNSGDTPDELLVILGLAGYPATSLEKFWLNGELVFDGDSTTGPGAITTGKFADDLWVWFRTGEETSAAFPDIAALSTTWDAKNRVLRGIPSIGIRLKITPAVESRFEPLAQIKGAKLYDPRLDSTVPGGSGAHRINDPATWAWSENPKLAELAYLIGGSVNGTRIFGMGKPAAAIDLENFASEANICEEQIGVVGGGSIDRYTCNGILHPQADHRTNLAKLLTASAGTMDASGGVYRTFAGAWRAPSMTLTESDIDGAPTEMQLQIDPTKEINIIGGAIADPTDEWAVKEYPELTDSVSIAQVGENPKKLDLPFTTDHRIAQRISKIEMKRLNAKRTFNAIYWLRAASLQPGDTVTQTYARYGITTETFRIMFWSLEASDDRQGARRLVVPMQLIEEQQSWFDWDEATEEKSSVSSGTLPSTDNRPRLTTLRGELTFEGASPPANPEIGWLWLDTDVDIVFRWSGSAWVEFSKVGADGLSVHVANVFKRSATAPATPAVDDGQFNFTTKVLTPPTGWSVEPPAGSDPLYVSTGSFSIVGATGTDTTVTWTAPDLLVQDGADGADGSAGTDGDDGLSVFVANVFKRSATAPSTPTADDGQYNFTTKTLTPPAGWSVEPPAGADPLYVSTGSFSVVGPTGIDTTVTWTAPDLLVQDGADGADGAAGADGDDGRPGLPGASTLALYDNADTNGSSSSQGRYHFLTSITDTSGTFSWSTITTPSGVDYISVHKLSTGGTTDYSSFYTQTQVGDVVTWYSSSGRWVAFEITSIETAPTDMFKWGVSYIIHDEFDGSGDIPIAAGHDVIFRWSRAVAGEPTVTLSGETISDSTSGNSTATVRINNDGTVDENTTSGGLVQIDTATDWVRPEQFAPGTYEHKATATGAALDGSSDPLNVWAAFTATPNPEWSVRSSGAEGSKQAVVTVEIRFQSGPVLDSGVYTLNSDDQA